MRLTNEQAIAAAMRMSLIIPGFPRSENGEAEALVAKYIREFVSTKDQMDWLEKTACKKMRRFSLPELRGIFCGRFPPADGVEGEATDTPGFTSSDLERAYIDRQGEAWREKIAEWKQELLLEGHTEEPVILPPVNEIPAPKGRPEPLIPDAATRKAQLRDAEKTLQEQLQKTPRRTDEENARLVRELEEKLGIKKA